MSHASRQTYRPWTEEEISMLLSLKDSGASFREISIALDRSIGSIASRANEPARRIRPKHGVCRGDEQSYDYRKATLKHLRDILKAHGYNAQWPSYRVPPESYTKYATSRYSPDRSLTGSSMAECGAWV